jgi:putative transposase
METFSLKLKLVVIFNGAKLTLVKRLKNRQLLWVDVNRPGFRRHLFALN